MADWNRIIVSRDRSRGYITVSRLSRRFEPYLREQAIEYLQKRFNSDVQIASLKVRLPRTSPIRLVLTHGRGAHRPRRGLRDRAAPSRQ